MHSLPEDSVASQVLAEGFNTENKKLFMDYIESYPNSHNWLSCNKHTTTYLYKAAKEELDIKSLLDKQYFQINRDFDL